MKKIVLTFLLSSLFAGCSLFSVYKVEVPQGTPLIKQQAELIKVGMNYQQVYFLLGSPTARDPLNPTRWDYAYSYVPGTAAKKAKVPASQGQYFKVYFDNKGIVTKIEGLENVPASQPGYTMLKKQY